MTLLQILIFCLYSLIVGWAAPPRLRSWFLLAGSLLGVFWLQSSSPVRYLDFILPAASIFLSLAVWSVTQPKEPASRRSFGSSLLLVAGILLALSLSRYVSPLCCLTPSRPPPLVVVLAIVGGCAALVGVVYFFIPSKSRAASIAIILLIALFIVYKSTPLAEAASAMLRRLTGQDAALSSSTDIAWLGFSYIAFRLLHVLRDYQSGRLPTFSSGEILTYALFYPSIAAGPIDRSQRFILSDLRREERPTPQDRALGLQRIFWGIFKKFVLADSLALVALSPQNALQVHSPFWLWLLLYAYSLRLFFDFSGYTDVAVGSALLVGIHLPENFDRPYLKTNLTAFWNSWHITLAQWFRAYIFNPLTRTMRSSRMRFPAWSIILTGQVATMMLIGLWHGITWNFAIWGLWHALGLFAHNRWTGRLKVKQSEGSTNENRRKVAVFSGWFLTFQYVSLGWVWFALPDPLTTVQVFSRLFGL